MSKLITIVVLHFMHFIAHGEDVEILFSWLENDDHIEIEYHSSGCFHNSTHYITLKKESEKYIALVASKQTPDTATKIELSLFSLKRMDQLLAFYKKPKSSGCTTMKAVKINYFEKEIKIHEEHFIDSSCSNPSPFTIQDIINRAEKNRISR